MAARPFPNNPPLALSSLIGRGREFKAVKGVLRARRAAADAHRPGGSTTTA